MTALAALAPQSTATAPLRADQDVVRIRGQELPLDRLVTPEFLDPAWQQAMHEQLTQAHPFPHLVLDNLFDARLLALVREEFDHPCVRWRHFKSGYETYHRSDTLSPLGPATQLYFSVVHSGWFTEALSRITGVDHLVLDPHQWGGGLHESGAGAHFSIHRDFTYHCDTGLRNRMVMITYLNEHWQDSWGGHLELWSDQQDRCEKKVAPEFGRTIVFLHGLHSFHGHPTPMTPPPGVKRRSVAAYYYTGEGPRLEAELDAGSGFYHATWKTRMVDAMRGVSPPILWSLARRAVRGRPR